MSISSHKLGERFSQIRVLMRKCLTNKSINYASIDLHDLKFLIFMQHIIKFWRRKLLVKLLLTYGSMGRQLHGQFSINPCHSNLLGCKTWKSLRGWHTLKNITRKGWVCLIILIPAKHLCFNNQNNFNNFSMSNTNHKFLQGFPYLYFFFRFQANDKQVSKFFPVTFVLWMKQNY